MMHLLETNEETQQRSANPDNSRADLKRMMIDSVPTLAWSTLTDGSAEFFNQRWFDYTGLKLNDVLGWGWRIAIHSDDLERLTDGWMRILASGKPGEAQAR